MRLVSLFTIPVLGAAHGENAKGGRAPDLTTGNWRHGGAEGDLIRALQATPLVVDGLMFVTGPLKNAAALDARTGRPIWRYTRRLPDAVHSH